MILLLSPEKDSKALGAQVIDVPGAQVADDLNWFNTAPESNRADPNCPKHGIEPMGEYEVAALNRQQVAAGILAGTAMLGLCSCTNNSSPDPTGSAGPTIEQTIEPTVQPSGDSTVTPTVDAAVQDWTATDNYLAVPVGITFPALTDANYEFSDTPQGAAEQWIFDTAPDQWALGIRAVTGSSNTKGYNYEDPSTPSALVQYIDGKRYEGTD